MKFTRSCSVVLFVIAVAVSVSKAGDVSYLIKNPSAGDGILFSHASSENGICKVLGYQKAATGSAVSSRTTDTQVLAIAEGSGAIQIGTTGRFAYAVGKIICLNRISKPGPLLKLLTEPRHPTSLARFASAASSSSGVCRSMGLARSVVGAQNTRWTTDLEQLVIAEPDGRISRGTVGKYDFAVGDIVCVIPATEGSQTQTENMENK